MKVLLNGQSAELPEGALVSDAIAWLAPTPPFAVAVNLRFIPRSDWATQALQAGDQIEIIAPVTGG
ncbi:sulfur carrier protein ThiS [Comamonas sp. NLF-1-9]|uniref:sulfur carrier protein ThiS n=1 Tax=Comamonas sp. NLF-1-9 TaxID=2853163 RepID=UPI001C44FDFC|nr:sulfur carrier protein ThiS [Comamonas sp. NLF-1-9]QXL85519.1 sulfur carrier protein ThiS [Comamonas sp. NLF-1-9]